VQPETTGIEPGTEDHDLAGAVRAGLEEEVV
jgi:hypothetical protein